MKETLSVVEVAKYLHKKPELIRAGIKSGVLPFGVCVEGKVDNFIIVRERFERWVKGMDMDKVAEKEKRLDEMLNTLQMQMDILNDQIYFFNKEKNMQAKRGS